MDREDREDRELGGHALPWNVNMGRRGSTVSSLSLDENGEISSKPNPRIPNSFHGSGLGTSAVFPSLSPDLREARRSVPTFDFATQQSFSSLGGATAEHNYPDSETRQKRRSSSWV